MIKMTSSSVARGRAGPCNWWMPSTPTTRSRPHPTYYPGLNGDSANKVARSPSIHRRSTARIAALFAGNPSLRDSAPVDDGLFRGRARSSLSINIRTHHRRHQQHRDSSTSSTISPTCLHGRSSASNTGCSCMTIFRTRPRRQNLPEYAFDYPIPTALRGRTRSSVHAGVGKQLTQRKHPRRA